MSWPKNLIIFSLVLSCTALCTTAIAENGLPQPVSPWLQNKTYPDTYKSPYLGTRDQIETQNNQLKPGDTTQDNDATVTEEQYEYLWDMKTEKQTTKPPSPLERAYSKRAGEPLTIFGHDIFTSEYNDEGEALTPLGAVQDTFILNTGDELDITFTGQRNDREAYKINTDGHVIIKDLQPIPAAGRTIADVRQSITVAISTLHNTKAFVSLSSVKQIGVLVVGHVEKPGRHNLSAFHSVLDAISKSGGIEKSGSLRKIKLVRQGRSYMIDLYDLLMTGTVKTDLRLQNGDRIIIPPIGPTIAVTGDVIRPAIYEIRTNHHGLLGKNKKSENLTLEDMLFLSGGIIAPGQNRFIKLELKNDGKEIVTEVTNHKSRQFAYGSILSVQKTEEQRSRTIELIGHSRKPGLHDIAKAPTLSALLPDADSLGRDIYPLLGIIERWDKNTLSSRYIRFSIRSVLNKKQNQKLEEGDKVLLFSKKEILDMNQDSRNKNQAPPLHKTALKNNNSDTSYIEKNIPLKNYILEHAATIQGAVRMPGRYPVADNVSLETLIAVAGGLNRDADTTMIEITGSYSNHSDTPKQNRRQINFSVSPASAVMIKAGDSIRINQTTRRNEERTVLIGGEVMNPGQYDLLPGDKMSDLLERAGGLTPQAYPQGAIFSREAERRAEKARFDSAAKDMKQSLAAAIERDKNPPDATQIRMIRELAAELETVEPLGRLTVETNPDMLSLHPEYDILLEPADRLYIPKRPLTVRVNGEVFSPASLQFRKDKDPRDYINEAGGFTYHADKDRAFVIYPDGSAQPLKVSAWNHTATQIPPGSTIVVPRDPKPFDFISSARDVSQILSNLAITSIFIDDIRD